MTPSEISSISPSFMPGGVMAPVGASGIVKSYNGNIALGDQRSFAALLGIPATKILLVQHIGGTGQVRIGPLNATPPRWYEPFENYALGSSINFQSTPRWDVDFSGDGIVQNGTILAGTKSLMVNVGVGGFVDVLKFLSQLPVGTLPPVPPTSTSRLSITWESLAPAAFGNRFFQVLMNGTGGNTVTGFDFNQTVQNMVRVYTSPAPYGAGVVPNNTVVAADGVKHTMLIDIIGAPAGDLTVTYTLDGVVLLAGGVVARPPADLFESFHITAYENPAVAGYTNQYVFDDIVNTISTGTTTGILVADGAGQEFQGGTIDLTQLAVATDSAALAPATIEVLAVS